MLPEFFRLSPRVVNSIEQVGQRVSDFLWCRLRLESLDDLALFGDEELSEIPTDVSGLSRFQKVV